MFGEYLVTAAVLDARMVAEMERAIDAEIADAFAFALASPDPTEQDLYRHVYAE